MSMNGVELNTEGGAQDRFDWLLITTDSVILWEFSVSS